MTLSSSISVSRGFMQTDRIAEPDWPPPAAELALQRTEIHVWRAWLDQPESQNVMLNILAPDEQARAARYHFQKDRLHYIIARGLLRTILSRYLNLRPEVLAFGYSAYGKPFLASPHGGDLRFNVSHSHGLALFAFARARDLGVDLEYIRPEVAGEQIAERFFSASEVASLRRLPSGAQPEA